MLASLNACTTHGDVTERSTYTSRDCQLLVRRCSRCHPIERVEGAHLRDPESQRAQVHRMRLMPASGIPPQEEVVIARCLEHWAGGTLTLTQLAAGAE